MALASSMTAFAEVGQPIKSLDEITNDKCFTIKVADQNSDYLGRYRGTWLYSADDASHLWSTTIKNVTVSNDDDNQKFAFIQSPSDPSKYFIYSVGGKRFLAYDSTPDGTGGTSVALVDQIVNEASVATFLNSTHSDKANYPWVVALGDKNGGSHQIGLSAGYYYGVITSYNNLGDGGNSLTLIDAGTFDPTDAEAKIEKFEEIYTDENKEIVNTINQYLSVPQYAVGGYDPTLWGQLNEACGGDGIADIYDVNDNVKNILKELETVGTLPITFSNDKVYKLQGYVSGSGYLCFDNGSDENSNYVYSSTKIASKNLTQLENSANWQIYTFGDKAILYNQGKQSFVKYDKDKDKWVATDEPVYIDFKNFSTAVFGIQDKETTSGNSYININNGNNESFPTGVLGYICDQNTAGSHFYVIEVPGAEAMNLDAVEGVVLILSRLKEKANFVLDSYVYDESKVNYVGSYSEEALSTLQKVYEDPNATVSDVEEALNSRKQVEAGKYYFLLNTMNFDDDGVKTIYANPDGTNVAWHTTEGTAAELWQFAQEDGGDGDYYIKNVNSGKSIVLNPGANSGSLQETSNTPFRFSEQGDDFITFGLQAWNNQNSDKATLVIKTSDENFGAYAKSSDESGNFIGAYNDFGAAVPSKWNIVEATSVNLTIGSTGYATAYFPFAVTIPEGVKAYTVSAAADGVATLSPLTGTIPANTGVILSGAADTYPFAIDYSSTASAVEGNKLQGVTMATDLDPETSYILAKGANGLGFYKVDPDDKTLAANKAYLVVSNAADASYSLKLDGAVTGIQSVENAAENAPAYDLQGRRLPQVPTKGLYIQNGKKIMK